MPNCCPFIAPLSLLIPILMHVANSSMPQKPGPQELVCKPSECAVCDLKVEERDEFRSTLTPPRQGYCIHRTAALEKSCSVQGPVLATASFCISVQEGTVCI